uniref:Fungal-type protein kinase domain-containing protein n=1 Tax=Schizophyllum commune (strain H4-8 / FGSC 9210) TaxID=578458 RepID=D8Q2W2_SCHCM
MLESNLGTSVFPMSLFPITPLSVIKLTNKAFYDVSNRRWLCYPDFSSVPDRIERMCAIASFFNRFTRFAWLLYNDRGHSLPSTPRRWYVLESPRLLADGSTVSSYGMALSEEVSGDLQWQDILCDVQVEEDAANMSDALQRLTTGAAHVFATQEHRLYHLGVALAGDTYQLAYYDRAGRVLSGAFDVHKHSVLFARIIMGLAIPDKSYAGLDPSIIIRDGRRFLEVCGREYEILRTICINTNMFGRGTVSWRCRRADSDEDFVIKNVDFASNDELLELLHDAIQAHQDLYLYADALHCDISENNIMAHDPPNSSRRRGLLIDLDSAVVVSGTPKTGPGTLPYLAIDVLQYPTLVERAPWHDLESFLYVLMIFCASYSGPSNTPRHGFKIHESPLGPWLAGDGNYKAQVMQCYDDAKFRAFLDEVFDPYFDDLKDVVCDLRNIITRPKDARPSHVDVMIVIDRHIRALRASQKRTAAAAKCPPAVVGTKRSGKTKRKQVTAAAHAPPAPRSAASRKPRRTTTRSKARAAPPPRTPSAASDESERTVVLTPPRRQTQAATKRAPSSKQAMTETGMAGATRAAKRRRME